MCLYPTYRINKKYTITKKNGGHVPPLSDNRIKYVATGCGKCEECKKQKARNWQVRLLEEVRQDRTGKFITLTFSGASLKHIKQKLNERGEYPEGYELDNAIASQAVRWFLERWRKKYKKSVKHWLITEIGGNNYEGLHLHGIIFTKESYETIEKIWAYGHIWPTKRTQKKTYVNEKTVNYIVKYVNKIDKKHPNYNPKVYTSKGIGKGYLERTKMNAYKGIDTKEYYLTRTGHKIALPTYYRNKIYTEEEREKLWINLIDKQVRFVKGEKIDISTEEGWNDYERTRDYHRKISLEKGYQDDSVNWDKKNYENQRRKLKIKEKIITAKK